MRFSLFVSNERGLSERLTDKLLKELAILGRDRVYFVAGQFRVQLLPLFFGLGGFFNLLTATGVFVNLSLPQ